MSTALNVVLGLLLGLALAAVAVYVRLRAFLRRMRVFRDRTAALAQDVHEPATSATETLRRVTGLTGSEAYYLMEELEKAMRQIAGAEYGKTMLIMGMLWAENGQRLEDFRRTLEDS